MYVFIKQQRYLNGDDGGALQNVSLTKVKISPLVSGLEEASPSLSVNISFFLHQQLSVVFTASLDGDVQRCLTYGTQ